MTFGRRAFLKQGIAATASAIAARASVLPGIAEERPDYELRIATGLVELAPNRFISTTLYNGQFPGPLIRLREGRPVVVDLINDTDVPEQVHWHGQLLPTDVDGAESEGTPFVPPHGRRRIRFTPRPTGLRLYHTHIFAGRDLGRGQYGGLVGPVYIEPRDDAGAYDHEVFLMLKEFGPYVTRTPDDEPDYLTGDPDEALRLEFDRRMSSTVRTAVEFEVEYEHFTINGKRLGSGDPLRVKSGDRVMFHVVNGSATDARSLALPGHTFRVVALDGNPVPVPSPVDVLWLAPGERVSATVDMVQPGVWILGDVGEARLSGMGLVVEYAGEAGPPEWVAAPPAIWDYTRFGRARLSPSGIDAAERLDMLITEEPLSTSDFARWRINDRVFTMSDMRPAFRLKHGRRYRLRVRNASDDVHPLHLHRHRFELTQVAGRPTAGILKDVVMIGRFQEVELEFTATSPGPSLFHCHMQSHMDYGFMAIFQCDA